MGWEASCNNVTQQVTLTHCLIARSPVIALQPLSNHGMGYNRHILQLRLLKVRRVRYLLM